MMRILILSFFLGLISTPLQAASTFDVGEERFNDLISNSLKTNTRMAQQTNADLNRSNGISTPLNWNFSLFLSEFNRSVARNSAHFSQLSSAFSGVSLLPGIPPVWSEAKVLVSFDNPLNIQGVHFYSPPPGNGAMLRNNAMVEFHGYGGAVLGVSIPVSVNFFRLQGGNNDHNH